MEGYKPKNSNEEPNSSFNKHKSFFSTKNLEKFFGKLFIDVGIILTLAGIYQFITGEDIGNTLGEYKEKVPEILKWFIDHLDAMSITAKAGGGISFIAGGQYLTGGKDQFFGEDNPDNE